jgi:hypothetical protein
MLPVIRISVDQSLHSRPDRIDTVRPVPSIIVRGSWRLSVEHCRSNSTRRPFAPSREHHLQLTISLHILHTNLVQIITIWMGLYRSKYTNWIETFDMLQYKVRHGIVHVYIFGQFCMYIYQLYCHCLSTNAISGMTHFALQIQTNT